MEDDTSEVRRVRKLSTKVTNIHTRETLKRGEVAMGGETAVELITLDALFSSLLYGVGALD